MTVLLWILGILVVLVLAAALWFGLPVVTAFVVTFVKEIRNPGSTDTEDEADEATARAVRSLGLLPASEQKTEHAAPLPANWTAALAAVRRREWQPAARVLEEIGRDWERRSYFTDELADLAAEDDTWLLAWEADRADDPDAAVVRARSTVTLAWEIRGADRAKNTTQEQFAGFHRVLVQAREHIARAAALNPADPTPFIAEIWVALGLGYPNSEMNRLWEQITARAPYHYEAHFSALQYWCGKWRGSAELAMDFAENAARNAPLGSLLTAFPLIAHYEHDDSDDTDVDRTPEMISRVDAALTDAAAADPTHPRLPELRHLLAYYLTLQDRHEAAIEQYKLVDGYVNALPWRYYDDMPKRYCRFRDQSVVAVAGG